MRFVVDTNIAVSLLKKDSFTRDLAKRYALELYSHPFILKEFDEHSKEFCSAIGISEDKFERIKAILPRLLNLKKKVSPLIN